MSHGMWDLKKLMFLVQGSLCFYCWKPMTQEKEHLKAAHYATKDHLVPVSQGGPADWTNTILACQTCNRLKADRMPTEAEQARHGHLYALFNERVEIRRAEIAAKEAAKAAALAPETVAEQPGDHATDGRGGRPVAGGSDASPVQQAPPAFARQEVFEPVFVLEGPPFAAIAEIPQQGNASMTPDA